MPLGRHLSSTSIIGLSVPVTFTLRCIYIFKVTVLALLVSICFEICGETEALRRSWVAKGPEVVEAGLEQPRAEGCGQSSWPRPSLKGGVRGKSLSIFFPSILLLLLLLAEWTWINKLPVPFYRFVSCYLWLHLNSKWPQRRNVQEFIPSTKISNSAAHTKLLDSWAFSIAFHII